MRKIVVAIIFSIFCGLNLFGDDVDLGIEFANKGDFAKANELWGKACEGEHMSSCFNLGVIYKKGGRCKTRLYKS